MHAPDTIVAGLFGDPPRKLVQQFLPPDPRQFSPLVPGAGVLESLAPHTLPGMTMLAPPGTLERRFALAAMLRALAPEAPFTVLAAKDMGGARLGGELQAMGCTIEESAKAHHRICHGCRHARLDEDVLREAHEAGAPRRLPALGLWSQPGIFSWDRIDPGTALLVEALPKLSGRGADLGCGIGVLAHAVLASPKVSRLELVDIDRRAVEAARRNVDDARVGFAWADVRAGVKLEGLDFVVMNPPFHDKGSEDQTLGKIFIQRAVQMLRPGGHLWLVANRHLPYEAALGGLFRRVTPHAEAHGYKIFSAVK